MPIPDALDPSFRRIAEGQGDAADGDLETRHLARQSLAAFRFVEVVGDRIRYDHGRRAWFIWHGHRWRPDRTAEIRRIWLDVLASRYRDALLIADGASRERTVAAITAAGATDSAIEASLRLAASSGTAAMAGDEWDPDPWALGCENGIVELRTGELRPGLPADLVTRSTRLVFDPGATCPRWERFLIEVFDGDTELIGWFRLLTGASFVGISKEVLAVHHGPGNNGKSVAHRTLAHVAGDYGVEIPIETLIGGRRDAGAPTSDLMRLRGARLAFTSEPDQAALLRGGSLKRLAAIDRMSGRELHGRQQEWDPTHTLHLATNHLPDVDDASDGFWRRIAVIPWRKRFRKPGEEGGAPPEDPRLAEELRMEAPGILTWAVGGAVDYARAGGLHPFPAAVSRETTIYRADEHPLREFIVRCLGPGDDDRATTIGELHSAYMAWAERAAMPRTERLNGKRFGRTFAELYTQFDWPVVRTMSAGRTAYRGLRLLGNVPAPWATDRTDGGDGGFGRPFARPLRAPMDPGKTGESRTKPTKPMDDERAARGSASRQWDEDLAEQATDDDAEAR